MLRIRPSAKRGHFDHGWLNTFHSFSFADYYDPNQMGFGPLRVINEDRIAGGQGFGEHGHSDMEIITYLLEGALEHKDSLGTGEVIRPGEVQRMTAGTGIRHSEFNASPDEPIHLLQIWIEPNLYRLTPGYEQKKFPPEEKKGRLRLVASSDSRDGSLKIHQDISIYDASLEREVRVAHEIEKGRRIRIQIARGSVSVNGVELSQGDGLAAEEESTLEIVGTSDGAAEILLFDMA